MEQSIIRDEFCGKLIYDRLKHHIYFEKKESLLPDNRTNRFLSAPTNVFLELTNICNLQCLHCFNYESKPLDILSLTDWKKVIDQLVDMNVFFVKITGGEPFLYQSFVEVLEYLDAKQLNYIVYTNGVFVKKYISKLVKRKNLITLRVSLEGTQKYNDYIRGKGNFDKTIEALKILDTNGIKYSINYTINRNNYKMLPELEEYIVNSCKLKTKIHLGIIKYAGNSLNHMSLCFADDSQYVEALQFIEEITKSSTFFEPLYMLPEYYFSVYGNHFGCPASQTSMVIKANGDVIPCGLISDSMQTNCGNVKVDTLRDIWNGKKMNCFRNLIAPKECISCNQFLKNCTGACRANALNIFGSIMCRDINCAIYKTSFARRRRTM